MSTWTWKLRFFGVFLVTGITLLMILALALVLAAFNVGGIFFATIVLLAEICFASFVIWTIMESEDYD